MDQQLDKIRLVAERYSELHGLRIAYAGVVWVAFGAALAPQADVTSLEILVMFIGALAIGLPGYWALGRYYANRFGRSLRPRRPPSPQPSRFALRRRRPAFAPEGFAMWGFGALDREKCRRSSYNYGFPYGHRGR